MGPQESHLENEDWRLKAACRSTDPDLFFPAGSGKDSLDQINAAKAVCVACAVRAACLEYALSTRQEYGIWGGASEDERKAILKARKTATE
jgi:WhiB family redox-sensing transcriptional regulator